MQFEVEINGTTGPEGRYVTYAPSPARIRQVGGVVDATLRMYSRSMLHGGGRAVFFTGTPPKSRKTLVLTVPASGAWVDFRIGGMWRRPSLEDRDCLLLGTVGGKQLLRLRLMVRLRRNANHLTAAERDRFLVAMGKVNKAGNGIYGGFRDMHVSAADDEMHGGPHFLPWHRAYLLDLERELQAHDRSVTIPFWRFDHRAPNVFRPEFMGATRPYRLFGPRRVVFSAGHPLASWTTESRVGVDRRAFFDTATSAAGGRIPRVRTQAETLALGDDYRRFARTPVLLSGGIEISPHGGAHRSCADYLSRPHTAPRDPLFFLLHSNVDRLWALWQWRNKRHDPTQPKTYFEEQRDGRRLDDTMWPWNGIRTSPRPNFAPRVGFPMSALTQHPGPQPTVRSMIDYWGRGPNAGWLAFGYEDVPFEF